jgi:hypothetical protein
VDSKNGAATDEVIKQAKVLGPDVCENSGTQKLVCILIKK